MMEEKNENAPDNETQEERKKRKEKELEKEMLLRFIKMRAMKGLAK